MTTAAMSTFDMASAENQTEVVAPLFSAPALRIVCVSDTHNDDCTGKIPAGDVFIHAGDMTDGGKLDELQRAFDWISALPHRVKVVVAGTVTCHQ